MNSIVKDQIIELSQICETHRVQRLELFGSAVAGGEFDNQASDLDFIVEFLPLHAGEYADNYFGLLSALQRLFGRPVDLVMQSAIRNRYFLESISDSKEVVYAA